MWSLPIVIRLRCNNFLNSFGINQRFRSLGNLWRQSLNPFFGSPSLPIQAIIGLKKGFLLARYGQRRR